MSLGACTGGLGIRTESALELHSEPCGPYWESWGPCWSVLELHSEPGTHTGSLRACSGSTGSFGGHTGGALELHLEPWDPYWSTGSLGVHTGTTLELHSELQSPY